MTGIRKTSRSRRRADSRAPAGRAPRVRDGAAPRSAGSGCRAGTRRRTACRARPARAQATSAGGAAGTWRRWRWATRTRASPGRSRAPLLQCGAVNGLLTSEATTVPGLWLEWWQHHYESYLLLWAATPLRFAKSLRRARRRRSSSESPCASSSSDRIAWGVRSRRRSLSSCSIFCRSAPYTTHPVCRVPCHIISWVSSINDSVINNYSTHG